MRTLAVGLSTRAIAESAAASGVRLVCLDYFGDRDQRGPAESYAVKRDFGRPWTPAAVREAARGLDYDAVLYTSDLENHPSLVGDLARDRTLLGNGPEVLRRVRDWAVLRELCREEAIRCPATLLPGEERAAAPGRRWLSKPARGGGGHGIRPWDGRDLPPGRVLQEEIRGVPASVSFVADGRGADLLGLSEQLLGRAALGASGFAWCGNLHPVDLPEGAADVLLEEVRRMVARLTCRFGLRGVNGVDLVLAPARSRPVRPWLVEVNPRYSASMELLERAGAGNVFERHVGAFGVDVGGGGARRRVDPGAGRGGKPSAARDGGAGSPGGAVLGKAVVFARRPGRAPDTAAWRERGRRDVPFPGDEFETGRPICTVFARGATRAACLRNLEREAARVHREVEGRVEDHGDRATPAHHRSHA